MRDIDKQLSEMEKAPRMRKPRRHLYASGLLALILLIALGEFGGWIPIDTLPIAASAWITGLCASITIGLLMIGGEKP